MAGSKKCKRNNVNKQPKVAQLPNRLGVQCEKDPDNFYDMYPSWKFHYADTEQWSFDEKNIGDIYWQEIHPRLKEWEKWKWKEILGDKKHNHPIEVDGLNPIARKRLLQLKIEAEDVYSLRFNGTHRMYGFISNGIFMVLWFDKDHGDNDTCVCRSKKKHT